MIWHSESIAENFEEKVLKADKPVLVDFYSDTCIPCKQMAGILGDIEDEHEDTVYIYKVNVNYDKALAEQYKVMSVPTVICFVNGEQKGKVSRTERTGRSRSTV